MKKMLLLFSLLSAILFQGVLAQAPKKKTDLEKTDLRGNVNTVHVSEYSGTEKAGQFLKKDLENESNETYSKKGYLTASDGAGEDIGGEYSYSLSFKYDRDDNMTEKKEISGSDETISKYKYNSQGDPVEIKAYDKKGNLTEKTVYTYNSNKLLEAYIVTDADKKLIRGKSFSYNSKSQLTSSREYDNDQKDKELISYEYDEKGNTTKEEIAGATGLSFTYNAGGQVSTKTESYNKGKEETTSYEYDKFGNMTAAKGVGFTRTYTYTYDDQNNWVKQFSIYKSASYKIVDITEKQISYY